MSNILNSVTTKDLKGLYDLQHAKSICTKLNLKFKSKDPWSVLVQNWDYPLFLKLSREIAQSIGGKYDITQLSSLKDRYNENRLRYISEFGDKLEWPFHPSQYDNWRKKYTYGYISHKEYMIGCDKQGLVQGIADLKSKLLEMISFHKNPEVFPVLKNKKGVDYFYHGDRRDWKNSKSLGKSFLSLCKKNGNDPIEFALTHPEIVAKSLFENQDSTRFGAETRHFIVSLNSDIKSADELLKSFESISFENPLSINFTYNGQDYSTQALVSYI
jgi:hypothetical protein